MSAVWISRFLVLTWLIVSGTCRPQNLPEDSQPDYVQQRQRMVTTQLQGRDIENLRVLAAARTVPRHLFVPEPVRAYAYQDTALPIGKGQTISQPYMVALMTQVCRSPSREIRALEIGTGIRLSGCCTGRNWSARSTVSKLSRIWPAALASFS